MSHLLLLLGSAVVIYVACEWFVNAVEWLGVRLKVGTLAVGTVLAAIGTALPESVVTFVAVVLGHDSAHDDLGMGAAMGGPLVLATVAYAVVGAVLLATGRRTVVMDEPGHSDVPVPTQHLVRDQQWFLAVFVVKVGLGLVTFALKPWLGLLFFAVYGVYTRRELAAEGEHEAVDLEPLRFARNHVVPPMLPVLLQSALTLAVIFVASQVFVGQLSWAGPQLGLSATVTALLLSPLATELPEVMNAVIWVRQGKTHLALANISGAMMIQATVPSALGLLFTPWEFDGPLLLSGLATMTAIVYLLVVIRSGRLTSVRLLGAGLFYVAFAVGLALLV